MIYLCFLFSLALAINHGNGILYSNYLQNGEILDINIKIKNSTHVLYENNSISIQYSENNELAFTAEIESFYDMENLTLLGTVFRKD